MDLQTAGPKATYKASVRKFRRAALFEICEEGMPLSSPKPKSRLRQDKNCLPYSYSYSLASSYPDCSSSTAPCHSANQTANSVFEHPSWHPQNDSLYTVLFTSLCAKELLLPLLEIYVLNLNTVRAFVSPQYMHGTAQVRIRINFGIRLKFFPSGG